LQLLLFADFCGIVKNCIGEFIYVFIYTLDKDIELVTNSAFTCQAFSTLEPGKCIMRLILVVGELNSSFVFCHLSFIVCCCFNFASLANRLTCQHF